MKDIIVGMEAIDTRQLWENVLVDIELSIPRATFNTWFRGTRIVRYEEGTVYVGVPNNLARDWFKDKYHKLILRALRTLAEDVRSVEYIIAKQESSREHAERIIRKTPTNELPFQELYIDRRDHLNPRYTFETLVVGPFNELAHAAAQAIVKSPAITYNPLYIYGNTGYGKTHLAQAVGNQIKKISPGKKIYYVTSEKFTIDVLNGIQTNSMPNFKDRYRQYDVLIMDDVQFVSGKEKTQEELFHLFNVLYDNNKQIIFTSDKHPGYLQNIEERLKSRFKQGMVVDISDPDFESRLAIIMTKAAANNFTLTPEIAEHLARSIDGNIRELEGALNAVMLQSQIHDRTLTIADVRNLIKDSGKTKKTISTKEIVKKVAEFYNIEEQIIYDKTRKKEVVRPRQIIMFILREDFRESFPSIGEKLGGRDHTTVIHSCEKIRGDIQTDSLLLQEINQIRAMLK